jgi:hypothetical protein
VLGIFEIGSCFCCLATEIILICASGVARIKVVSHWCPAKTVLIVYDKQQKLYCNKVLKKRM